MKHRVMNHSLAKGSYTVEAALVVPLLLFTMALGMKIGLTLYEEMKDEQEIQWAETQWEVEDFYRNQWLKEALEDE